MSIVTTTPNKLPETTLKGNGKLILTRELQDQIDFSHKKVGNIEWCGVLFYDKLAGDITNPESLIFEARRFYMMDIGTHGYTEAQFSGDTLVDMYTNTPEAEDIRRGLIH